MTKLLEQEVSGLLKSLHLSAVQQVFTEQSVTARQENLSYEEYLLELLRFECEVRKNNKINRFLRISKLPLQKNLETFDQSRLPHKLTLQLRALLRGDFLEKQENILAFGNPGSGKTHLLCALGQELINQGYSVLFTTCQMLVQQLLAAKRDLQLEKAINKLGKFKALIIDDIGYVEQSREEMEVLFTLLAHRYERGSVMLSSNLPFSKWEQIFKDPMTTAAAIDRLVHHSVILELNVESYRLAASKKKKANK